MLLLAEVDLLFSLDEDRSFRTTSFRRLGFLWSFLDDSMRLVSFMLGKLSSLVEHSEPVATVEFLFSQFLLELCRWAMLGSEFLTFLDSLFELSESGFLNSLHLLVLSFLKLV